MVFLKCDNIKLYYFINFCFKDAIKPNFYIYYANYFFKKKNRAFTMYSNLELEKE
jgi:hypothetical protein